MTHKSAIAALQKALYTRLSGELAYRVYDDVPDNPDWPYIVIGEDEETVEPSSKGIALTRHVHEIHIFSRYAGAKECVEMIDAVCQALDDPLDMAADGFAEVELLPYDRSVAREYDNAGAVYRHGTVTVRATIQQN